MVLEPFAIEGQNTKAKIIPVTSQRLTLSLANENFE